MKITLSFILIFASLILNAQTHDTIQNKPVIYFLEKSHDFGDIIQGDIVKHVFKFNNTGRVPLIISSITASCGCTSPQYSKEPVMPGKSGEIEIQYNSRGKQGINNVGITIASNAGAVRLNIRVNVLQKK
jgi:hypothetical protein